MQTGGQQKNSCVFGQLPATGIIRMKAHVKSNLTMTAKASEGNEDKNHLFKNQTWFVEDWKENSKGFEDKKN